MEVGVSLTLSPALGMHFLNLVALIRLDMKVFALTYCILYCCVVDFSWRLDLF